MGKWKTVTLKCKAKEIMDKKGITAYQMAKDLGVRRNTVNDIIRNNEMEKRRIPATLIAQMKVYLDCSFDDLFEVIEKEEQKESSDKFWR
jgi:plasmid maintenance system antidote protein VapI